MTNSKHPIKTPEDAKGIRMRTLESSVCVDSLGELGIDAVSMSFGELFTALQTGAVDGQENPLFTIYNSRFYEVQKYLSLTEHFYPVCPLMVSDLMWDKLSDEDAAIVKEELYDMVDYEREVAGDELDKTRRLSKIREWKSTRLIKKLLKKPSHLSMINMQTNMVICLKRLKRQRRRSNESGSYDRPCGQYDFTLDCYDMRASCRNCICTGSFQNCTFIYSMERGNFQNIF